ncbi:hypothetical protein LUW75_03895 [Streptomyces sp. MRC013]|uniref:hypothetical protein n=1 Tax=Streptomyces sp. MRC013 TaxID=2898276 RepID=UPI0020275897|nr:hypothetical protein [Streptomyces sp. MRC013]URM89292.1 hypothetical protein LUW75_03895 [Streptomyces sp. MRC013]
MPATPRWPPLAAKPPPTPPGRPPHRRWRPPVERVIAWLVAHGHRRAPSRGVIRTDRRLHQRAAALNLRRLTDLGLDHRDGTRVINPAPT